MFESDSPKLTKQIWSRIVTKYQIANTRKAVWQIVNTFVPFFVVWYLAYRALAYSYWLALGLVVLAAGLLMRIFIIQHDCGHGSFFKSKQANDILGSICGVLTLTPYFHWRKAHSIHHATAGNLDKRGVGDVYTMTVGEYLQASKWERFKYRFFRHPLVLLGLGPTFVFILSQRFPVGLPQPSRRELNSVYLTDLAALALVVVIGLAIGFREFLIIYLPVSILAATAGVWLFYVQHQFEDVYWRRAAEWDYTAAAMEGCSYYKLPQVLQWFSGSIGYHHIHHLSPRIPNYHLQKCYDENPALQKTPLTFWPSLRCFLLGLWDEEKQKLVGFGDLGPAQV